MTVSVHHADARDLLNYVTRGGVRLAFLDPPFNTGKHWQHYEDKRTTTEWLDLMATVFVSLRSALSIDGSVWVNLDERMHARCRLLMDDVFGENRYVATIQWHKKNKPGPARGIHTVHNPILVYGREPQWTRAHGVPPLGAHQAQYRYRDDDGRMYRLRHDGSRTYLDDLLAKGAMPHTWWDYRDVGDGETARAESEALFGMPFATPKPEALMRRIIHIATDEGDWVLDPFAGSGTTLAVANAMRRNAIGLEIEQATIEKFIRVRLGKGVKKW